jgi:hypothetical protein
MKKCVVIIMLYMGNLAENWHWSYY